MEYIDEAFPSHPLLPAAPLLRARCRLSVDFINKSIVPSFYKYLQEQDESKWSELGGKLVEHMFSFGKQILENDKKYSTEKGSYYLGGHFTNVDIALIPWYNPLFESNSGLFASPSSWKNTKVSNSLPPLHPKKEKSGNVFTNGSPLLCPERVLSQP